ncbi:nuclear transport factor 2 family protein [Paraburkholderia oxyphila]|uniref:nuclear transport factor 2 family protein n=1 Tax=Paraburkholderia oxyphila TaxID=614212 RepID=UPI00048506BA|nr:nuclear transport factor 2 family protein [Paraburkholderia oxyphila]
MRCNIETMFSNIDAKDVDGFLANLADNVVFQFANASPLNGKGAVREGVASFYTSIAALSHEITGKWEVGETTVLRFKTVYTRHDGNDVEVPCSVILHHIEDGRIDDYRIYTDLSPVFAPAVH